MPVEDAPEDDGPSAPRQSYNFAPGYHGIVYRARTVGRGSTSTRPEYSDDDSLGCLANPIKPVCYKLQSMRWGLIPFWTKRNPNYGAIMKSINCRDDSLCQQGGMWASMKRTKRCIVIAEGFFEWLKTGPKDKLPHYIKRKDGHLMCLAGLWDCVTYEDSDAKTYTYAIITTDANKQTRFIHDRMPVILDPGCEDLRTWLDPNRTDWSHCLQSLLKPFEGELEIYAVKKDVGKVGNDSPSFVIPLDSKENKSNIVHFFPSNSKHPEGQVPVKAISTRTEATQISPTAHHPSESLGKRKGLQVSSLNKPPSKRPSLSNPALRDTISATKNKGSSNNFKVSGTPKITNYFDSNK